MQPAGAHPHRDGVLQARAQSQSAGARLLRAHDGPVARISSRAARAHARGDPGAQASGRSLFPHRLRCEAEVTRLERSTLARYLRMPLQGGALAVIVLFAILLALAARAGLFGLPLALILLSWFFK